MATALTKGSRITGAQRTTLAAQYAKRYAAGDSIREIADDAGRSYGFVHGVLKESGSTLRGRGGATRGVARASGRTGVAKKTSGRTPAKSSTNGTKATVKKIVTKTPAKPARIAAATKAPVRTTTKAATAQTPAKKAPAKKTAAQKSTVKKATATTAAPTRKAAAKKTSRRG